jgi:hypothetical protein
LPIKFFICYVNYSGWRYINTAMGNKTSTQIDIEPTRHGTASTLSQLGGNQVEDEDKERKDINRTSIRPDLIVLRDTYLHESLDLNLSEIRRIINLGRSNLITLLCSGQETYKKMLVMLGVVDYNYEALEPIYGSLPIGYIPHLQLLFLGRVYRWDLEYRGPEDMITVLSRRLSDIIKFANAKITFETSYPVQYIWLPEEVYAYNLNEGTWSSICHRHMISDAQKLEESGIDFSDGSADDKTIRERKELVLEFYRDGCNSFCSDYSTHTVRTYIGLGIGREKLHIVYRCAHIIRRFKYVGDNYKFPRRELRDMMQRAVLKDFIIAWGVNEVRSCTVSCIFEPRLLREICKFLLV